MPKHVTRRTFIGTSVGLTVMAPTARLGSFSPALLRAEPFGANEKRILRAAIDTLIPPAGGMPAASAVGGVDYIDRVTAADARMRALVSGGLRAVDTHCLTATGVEFAASRPDQQLEVLSHFERADTPAGFFAALRDITYEAYYTQPQIWKLLGYTFRRSSKRTAQLERFDENRVARVRIMAPLFLDVSS